MDKEFAKNPSTSAIPVAPPPAYTDEDAAWLLGTVPPAPTSLQPLPLPVCLPQTVSGFDSPFARAYNPELMKSGINESDWLKFLDGLNIAMTASPPLRVVDMAGMVIGFVPFHWAIIAGALLQTVAQTAIHVIQKTLTDRYLRRANTEYFEPRGLKIRLMKTAAMRKFVHIDSDTGTPSKAKDFAKKAGHVAESVLLRLPIPFVGRILSMIPNASPDIDHNMGNDLTHRRLADLEGYIMPVTTQVPPPTMPESLLDKTSALAIKLREWSGRKRNTKAMRQRRLLAVAEGREPASILSDTPGGMTRRERRRMRRGGSRVQTRRLRYRVAKANRLEYITTDGLVWVVLINAEQADKEIEGRELVDNSADVEEIGQDEWEEQIEFEDEEDVEEVRRTKEASTSNAFAEAI